MTIGRVLNDEERRVRDDLETRRREFNPMGPYEIRIESLRNMRDLAHKLHMSLKDRGVEPKHHQYMLDNRQVPPDDPDFYLHPHSIDDLIKFTYDPTANDDPEDLTIGREFEIEIYSRRWDHNDTLTLKRTAHGWFISYLGASAACDKSGDPILFEHLRHDGIAYPNSVGIVSFGIMERRKRSWPETRRRSTRS